MSTTTQKQNQQQNQQQQKQQPVDSGIDSAANFIRKRLEDVKPAQLIFRTSEFASQKELAALTDENMNQLSQKLSSLDIKMVRVKDPADQKQEALEFILSEEGEERFEVPEEEEGDEATQPLQNQQQNPQNQNQQQNPQNQNQQQTSQNQNQQRTQNQNQQQNPQNQNQQQTAQNQQQSSQNQQRTQNQNQQQNPQNQNQKNPQNQNQQQNPQNQQQTAQNQQQSSQNQNQQQTGGSGGRGQAGNNDQPVVTNRSYPRPLPEPVRNIDVSQIRTFSDVLKNITVQRVAYENWTRKNLVLVNSNQPVDRALSRINTHNVHSLPVVDANSNNGSVIGVIDILDIISALSESWDNNSTRAQRREKLVTPISDLLSRNTHQPTFIMSVFTPILDAIKEFASSNLSRVLIVERRLEKTVMQQDKPEEFVIGLLTQSDLIRFMAENIMWIKKEPLFQKTVQQLNLGQKKPIIVQPNILAYQAFQEIHKNEGREGVALVDDNGKLIANISASNIKGMTRANIQLLNRPLTDFLARDRKRGWWQLPICTSLDATLENVILQFVGAKTHRMYLVDDDGKPTGEISLSDVLKQLGNL